MPFHPEFSTLSTLQQAGFLRSSIYEYHIRLRVAGSVNEHKPVPAIRYTLPIQNPYWGSPVNFHNEFQQKKDVTQTADTRNQLPEADSLPEQRSGCLPIGNLTSEQSEKMATFNQRMPSQRLSDFIVLRQG